MLEIIQLTLIVNISSTILGMIIGVLLGYRLYFSKSFLKPFWVYLTKTLMGIPPVVLGLILFIVLRSNGPLGFFGLLFTPRALIIAQTLLIIPIVAGNVYQLLISKGEVLFFTLNMYKLSFINKIKYSILQFRNELIFIMILGFSRAVSEVGAVMIVGGNIRGHTRIMTTALANLRSQGHFEEAIVYGVVLLAITFIIQFFVLRLGREEDNCENF